MRYNEVVSKKPYNYNTLKKDFVDRRIKEGLTSQEAESKWKEIIDSIKYPMTSNKDLFALLDKLKS